MRSINDWKQEFVDAITAKFPSEWSQEKRLENMQREVLDVIKALKFEKDEISGDDHRLTSVEERMGGVFADLFMLADARDSDLEEILQGALQWFKDPNKKPGQA